MATPAEAPAAGKKAVDTQSDAAIEKIAGVKNYFESFYRRRLRYSHERDTRKAEWEGKQRAPVTDVKLREFYNSESSNIRKNRKRTRITDFEVIKMIGKGGYGEVFLVRKRDSRELLALKRMKKEFILASEKEMAHIRTERNVLALDHSDWLVQLMYSFQDDANVYMAMEYCPGGDLRTLISNLHPFEEGNARFYVAEMFLSVDALHKQGYIHRDLKPENFLIDVGGHIKLTDFGLSKGNMMYIENGGTMRGNFQGGSVRGDRGTLGRSVKNCKALFGTLRKGPRTLLAYSLVGSPDYMACEMLEKQGYDFTVDHWAIACILFEMMTGFPPFAAETIEEVFTNVYNWEQTLNYGDIESYMTNECWELIRAILCEPGNRLGSNGLEDIKKHRFFGAFPWDTIRQTGRPPFVPELADATSTKYFDEYEDNGTLAAAASSGGDGSARTAFHCFTYVRPKDVPH